MMHGCTDTVLWLPSKGCGTAADSVSFPSKTTESPNQGWTAAMSSLTKMACSAAQIRPDMADVVF